MQLREAHINGYVETVGRSGHGNARALLLLSFLVCLAIVPSVKAAILTHTFTISGDNGETGSGTFTWDDSAVSNGSAVSSSLADLGNIISLRIEISGGNVIAGPSVFTNADCAGAYLEDSPDFTTDINFNCNNGVNTLSGAADNTNYLNDTVDFGAGLRRPVLGASSSTLTFSPGTTASASTTNSFSIPATPWWSLGVIALLMMAITRNYSS